MKIEAKRLARKEEEEALAAERRAIKLKRQYLAADASAVEAKKWHSQEKGAERELTAKQKTALVENKLKKQVRLRVAFLHYSLLFGLRFVRRRGCGLTDSVCLSG